MLLASMAVLLASSVTLAMRNDEERYIVPYCCLLFLIVNVTIAASNTAIALLYSLIGLRWRCTVVTPLKPLGGAPWGDRATSGRGGVLQFLPLVLLGLGKAPLTGVRWFHVSHIHNH